MGTIKGLPESITRDTPLAEVLDNTIEAAKETTIQDGSIEPCLIIVGQTGHVVVDAVPDGRLEMAKYFTDMVEQFKGAKAYIFITESWVLQVSADDREEVNKYINNPDSIADNPFKEERLTFHAVGEDEALEAYVKMTRDDSGQVVMGTTVIEQAKEHFSNVADLLIPMVQ